MRNIEHTREIRCICEVTGGWWCHIALPLWRSEKTSSWLKRTLQLDGYLSHAFRAPCKYARFRWVGCAWWEWGREKIKFQRAAASSDLTNGDNRNFSIVSFGGGFFLIAVWSSDPRKACGRPDTAVTVWTLRYVSAVRRTMVLAVSVTDPYRLMLLAELAIILVRILWNSQIPGVTKSVALCMFQ